MGLHQPQKPRKGGGTMMYLLELLLADMEWWGILSWHGAMPQATVSWAGSQVHPCSSICLTTWLLKSLVHSIINSCKHLNRHCSIKDRVRIATNDPKSSINQVMKGFHRGQEMRGVSGPLWGLFDGCGLNLIPAKTGRKATQLLLVEGFVCREILNNHTTLSGGEDHQYKQVGSRDIDVRVEVILTKEWDPTGLDRV